ncbi:MAG: PAS domain S-box protein [Alphaproteobacteria bacterium]|jgi:PAS domain S-box-containing protein|nr:PAS domain S-box protein [Alphaproteobacteria bacterium]
MANENDAKPDYQAMSQAELIGELARLREALAALPEGFVLYDRDRYLSLCNDNFRDTYPWARDLIGPGLRFEDLVRAGVAAGAYPEAEGRAEEYLADRLAQYEDCEGTYLRQLTDGRWLQCRNRRTAEGGVVGIRTDVTDLKQREQDPAGHEVRLTGMLSVAPDAIVAMGEDSRIRVFNPGAEKLFGYAADEVLGQSLALLMPDRFRALHGAHVRQFLESGEQSRLMTERSEIIGLRADGSEFPAEASVSKMEMGEETVLTVMLHDVTERKRAEAELIAAKERAENALIQAEKMAAIGTLASGIGHEINNPLYAVMGAAEAIRDGNDLGRAQEHAQDIIGYCKHVAEIIKNLSGYIRPGETQGLEPVDVNQAIREAVSMAELSLQGGDLEIHQRLEPVPPIGAKPEEVQQAFFNVIRNGLQAIGSHGTMEIESRQTGERVSVRIRDSGAGIEAKDLVKIYDPFFTTKDPDEGEGLGLFVVQQIVKKYSGTIEYQSEVGQGTLCTIEFPIREMTGGTR